MFIAIANAMGLAGLLAAGELAARWHVEGGLRAAVLSFFFSPADRQGQGNSWLAPDDLLGYKLNPATPGVNALGIRHAEITREKAPGVLRVIVLGDSVAWHQHGFVTLLRERLSTRRPGRVEVINAAIPGYTTYQERHQLERDLLPLRPDLVVLEYCLNDNHQFLHRLNNRGRWLLTPEAEGVLVADEFGPLSGLLKSSYLYLELRLRFHGLTRRPRGTPPWQNDPGLAAAWEPGTWRQTEAHLLAMRRRTIEMGGRLAVVAVPIEPQLQPQILEHFGAETLKPQAWLTEICSRIDVPLLDLYPAFSQARQQKLYVDGLHLSPAGHELVANELLRFLDDRKLIQP